MYQKPEIEIIDMEPQNILCTSIIATGSINIDDDKDASVFDVEEDEIWKN